MDDRGRRSTPLPPCVLRRSAGDRRCWHPLSVRVLPRLRRRDRSRICVGTLSGAQAAATPHEDNAPVLVRANRSLCRRDGPYCRGPAHHHAFLGPELGLAARPTAVAPGSDQGCTCSNPSQQPTPRRGACPRRLVARRPSQLSSPALRRTPPRPSSSRRSSRTRGGSESFRRAGSRGRRARLSHDRRRGTPSPGGRC